MSLAISMKYYHMSYIAKVPARKKAHMEMPDHTLPLCITDGNSEASLELCTHREWPQPPSSSCSGQSLPPGWEAQAGQRLWGINFKKKKKRRKKKEKKTVRSSREQCPWASLTAFLPGPSPQGSDDGKVLNDPLWC